MAKQGKRYTDAAKQVDRNMLYDPRQALELVKNLAKAKFDETVEIALKLGVDPRHADQQVRGAIVLRWDVNAFCLVLQRVEKPRRECRADLSVLTYGRQNPGRLVRLRCSRETAI